jgi:hypothetical protein
VADLVASVVPNFLQTACSGLLLQKSLQQEWQFVQRVTKHIGPKVADAKVALLSKTFLPTLFGDHDDKDDPQRTKMSCVMVKCWD